MDVRVGLWRRLSTEEFMLLNCGVVEDTWESLGLQRDPTSPFWRRSALGFLWKEWCWSWNSNTLATSCEELTQWKRLCWWEYKLVWPLQKTTWWFLKNIKKQIYHRIQQFHLWIYTQKKTWFLQDTCTPIVIIGDLTSPFWRRSALGFLWKEWC